MHFFKSLQESKSAKTMRSVSIKSTWLLLLLLLNFPDKSKVDILFIIKGNNFFLSLFYFWS